MHLAVDGIHQLRIAERQREYAALPAGLDSRIAAEVDALRHSLLPCMALCRLLKGIVTPGQAKGKRAGFVPGQKETPAAGPGFLSVLLCGAGQLLSSPTTVVILAPTSSRAFSMSSGMTFAP